MKNKIKHIVLTGTPNAGKSHLFDAMRGNVDAWFPEQARELFKQRNWTPEKLNKAPIKDYIDFHKEISAKVVCDMEVASIYDYELTLHDRWIADTVIFVRDKLGVADAPFQMPILDEFESWVEGYEDTILRFKENALFVVVPHQFGKPTHSIHTTNMFENMHDIWCDNVLVLPTYEELGSQDVQQYIELIMAKVNEINGVTKEKYNEN